MKFLGSMSFKPCFSHVVEDRADIILFLDCHTVDRVYKYKCHRQKLFDGGENNRATNETLKASWETDDPNILESPYNLFYDLYRTINHNIDLYGRLLTLSGTSNLVHKIIQMIRQQVRAPDS